MFVKKLVDKATKKSGGGLSGLRADDVNPRLVFHYGIPAGSSSLAYDPIQKILAVSTKDGRIKLFGKDNTQALLDSNEPVPSKFLQFLENQGILVNVNTLNHIEVWNLESKQLTHVHVCKNEITSFLALERSPFMYVGDSHGNVSVLRLDQERPQFSRMQYHIPFTASHGSTGEVIKDAAIMFALPQPLSENKRALLIFRDGVIVLWDIKESKAMFKTGGSSLYSLGQESKKVTAACWACPSGSKIVVGYSNGEIFLWGIPSASSVDKEGMYTTPQTVPVSKLNLGYKIDKIPVLSLRWVNGDGHTGRLYVNGTSDDGYTSLFQVVILQDNNELRTIKLMLPLPKSCISMEIISSCDENNKHKQDFLLLLLESGHLCAFDDSDIEKYLSLSQQSKTAPAPNHVMVKLPFMDSSITVAKYFTENSNQPNSMDENHLPSKTFPSLTPIFTRGKNGDDASAAHYGGFTQIRNLYITGHASGAINIWDVSCPFLLLVLSIQQQSQEDHFSGGVPLTALHFDISSRILISGDKHGMVHIFTFKPEQGSKQGCSFIIHRVKLIKVVGSVLSINVNPFSGHLVVGSDEGCVSIINMEGPTLLCQKRFSSELYMGAISLQFEHGSPSSSQKNILFVALQDSSVLVLDGVTGNPLTSNAVHPKQPARALFLHLIDEPSSSGHTIDDLNQSKDGIPKQSSVLVCSENAVRLYSLTHLVQGIKKVNHKKKLHGTCCWASTFCTPNSDIALVLLFTSGKIEIRSLPELSLRKEISLKGLILPISKTNSGSNISVSCSSEGEIVLVNEDQEIFLLSILYRNDIYRCLDTVSQVYKQPVPIPHAITPKEKKKGLFSSVLKDLKGTKSQLGQDTAIKDFETSNAELSVILSTVNFPLDAGSTDELNTNDKDIDLDIDDIKLEDEIEKPKGRGILSINKHKLSGKLQVLKGKLSAGKLKTTEASEGEEQKNDNNGSLDVIKKRYGYSSASDSSSAKVAESKLSEHLKKLQGIGTRTASMQNTAQTFSATAKDLLRTLERGKGS